MLRTRPSFDPEGRSPLFNWPQFLASHGVAYVTRGPNTGPGQLSIRCPMCGTADPSEHLAINLKGAGWYCRRNPRAHSGRSRSRLIRALLRCSDEEARRLAGEDTPTPTPPDADFGAEVSKRMGLEPVVSPKRLRLDLLPEFKPFGDIERRGGLVAPFWDYFMDRGYGVEQTVWLADSYNLHYATRGPYRYRIIIPIEDVEGRLQTWTGRSIVPGGTPRYKTLSMTGAYGPDDPVALKGPTDLLLGLPLLLRVPNPQTLVLCEGPFDATRITALGHQYGVYGTCLFGLNISEAQVTLLDRLMSRFNRLVLLLDPDARHLTLRIKEHLTPLPVVSGVLPAGVEDPGALPVEQGRQLVQSWV